MEKKFEVANHYTPEMFADFSNFHCKYVQGIAYLRYLGFFIFVAAIYQLMAAPGFMIKDLLLSPVVLFSLGFIFMSYQIPSSTAKRLYKNALKTNSLETRLTFYDDYITIQSTNADIKFYYGQLRKSYETKRYFYIYTQRGIAQVIDKASFTIGDPAQMGEFLSRETELKLIKKLKFE